MTAACFDSLRYSLAREEGLRGRSLLTNRDLPPTIPRPKVLDRDLHLAAADGFDEMNPAPAGSILKGVDHAPPVRCRQVRQCARGADHRTERNVRRPMGQVGGV